MLPQPPAIVNAITFHLVFSIRSFHHAMISNGSKVRLFIVHDNGTDCDMRKRVSVFDYLFFFFHLIAYSNAYTSDYFRFSFQFELIHSKILSLPVFLIS